MQEVEGGGSSFEEVDEIKGGGEEVVVGCWVCEEGDAFEETGTSKPVKFVIKLFALRSLLLVFISILLLLFSLFCTSFPLR